jgi:hypothetical protein
MSKNMADHMISTYQMMSKQKILLSHFGTINPEITNTLLRNLKNDINSFEEEEISKKKVYKVTVECLENICRHADQEQTNQPSAIFLLGKDDENYHVISGNYVYNEDIQLLTTSIEEINHLDKEHIKDRYRDVLKQNKISIKGGAQLGIIDMALKSGNKLEYEFFPTTDGVSFFILKIQIPRITTLSK